MEIKKNYTHYNAITWDRWASEGNEWSIPISHEKYLDVKNGRWDVVLTPCKPVPHDWFPPFSSTKILGLASGGGQQMPVFRALGAEVVLFDLSDRQLQSERDVANRERYSIDIIKGDMTKPLPFADETFDLIFHPVSNSYIEDVQFVWNECFRVLKKNGILLAGLDNGINFLFDEDEEGTELKLVHHLPYNPLKDLDESELEKMFMENDGIQFSHTIEEQIGGQLKAGFTLTDLFEDYNDYGELAKFIPTFVATRAVKK
jgi:SAM-dependent methyltransferase